MLQNWLSPFSPRSINAHQLRKEQFGASIAFFPSGGQQLNKLKIGLIGLDHLAALAVRKELYQFSWSFDQLSIADLGDVRRNEPEFLVPLIRELLDSGIFPLLIGSSPKLVHAQYQAFLQLKANISLSLIDERAALSARHRKDPDLYLNEIVHGQRKDLFHLGLIGGQSHRSEPKVLQLLERRYYEYIRLGTARADLSELEPTIRDADLAAFNMTAIRASEIPGVSPVNPSGFFTEEACRICRYAGMSDKLKSFGVFGLPNEETVATISAKVAAQLLWYFIDGFYHRKQDYPVSNQGLTEYIVSFKHQDTALTFWRSNRSGRWWIQAPVESKDVIQRHRLIPCSYRDYQAALREELPDRLVNAFRRFL